MTTAANATIVLTPAQAEALENILTWARRKAEREIARIGRPRGDAALERLRAAWADYGEQAAELLAVLRGAAAEVPHRGMAAAAGAAGPD